MQFFSLLYSASASNASPAKTRHGFEPNVGFALCNETTNNIRELQNSLQSYHSLTHTDDASSANKYAQ